MVLVVERKVLRRTVLHLEVYAGELLLRFLGYDLESKGQSLIRLNHEVDEPLGPFATKNVLRLVTLSSRHNKKVPILVNNAFNKYVEVIQLLLCHLLYGHVDRINIRDFESFGFDVVH